MREWGGGPTDNLNINKRGVQIQGGGGLKNVLTNCGGPKQNVFPPSTNS